MARTRGGRVTSGTSARSRRTAGRTSSTAAGGATGRGELLVPSPPQPQSAEDDVEAMRVDSLHQNSVINSSSSNSNSNAYGSRGLVSPRQCGGGMALQTAGSSSIELGGGSGDVCTAVMPPGMDEDAVHDDILSTLFDDTSGDELDDAPPVRDTSVGMAKTSASSTSYRPTPPLVAARKSPLSPPKPPVWRMLYVDPDVADPKLVAERLEAATSLVLQCGCVFDVAADVVEALSDLRGDTMWVYRGVFINESLYRYSRSMQSIQGKHLSQFLRQAGMSGARIILLVAGDVQFDTVDAAAHGLSAVLRKPFTRDGFCDILRGMYLSDDSTTAVPSPPPPPLPTNDPVPTSSYPRGAFDPHLSPSLLGHHNPYPPTATRRSAADVLGAAIDRSAGSSVAAVAAAAAVAMHGGPPVLAPHAYPECLRYTPFPPAMLKRYNLVSGLLCAGQGRGGGGGGGGQRRKYTKIAPREDEESAVAGAPQAMDQQQQQPNPGSPVSSSAVATTAGGVINEVYQGRVSSSSLSSAAVGGIGSGDGAGVGFAASGTEASTAMETVVTASIEGMMSTGPAATTC